MTKRVQQADAVMASAYSEQPEGQQRHEGGWQGSHQQAQWVDRLILEGAAQYRDTCRVRSIGDDGQAAARDRTGHQRVLGPTGGLVK